MANTNGILTTTLRNGATVLAKQYKDYGPMAYTFANETQAVNRAAALRAQGVKAEATKFVGSRPFYVVISL